MRTWSNCCVDCMFVEKEVTSCCEPETSKGRERERLCSGWQIASDEPVSQCNTRFEKTIQNWRRTVSKIELLTPQTDTLPQLLFLQLIFANEPTVTVCPQQSKQCDSEDKSIDQPSLFTHVQLDHSLSFVDNKNCVAWACVQQLSNKEHQCKQPHTHRL